ncbi:MAG TPA: hypothetical protein VHR85_02020 [Nocardioides sp.]|nr:hypothetical protein [Nocardioides sp.]
MTDRPDSPESEDSAEMAEVRRLLAGARHADPMPDDVAARMDDVLAGLRDTPQTSPATRPHPPGAEVVPIAAHRRRRAAGLLAAAAAIVVGGVVVAPHVHVHSGGSSAATTAEDSTAGGRELGNTGNSKNPLAPQARGNGKAHLRDGRIVVRPQHFSADARAGRQLLGPSASMSVGGDTDCPDVPQRASTVAAEYQHAPAALVYRRVEGSSQVVDLYVCGNPRPVRSTTLSVP